MLTTIQVTPFGHEESNSSNIYFACPEHFYNVKQYISKMTNNVFPEGLTIYLQKVKQYIYRTSNNAFPLGQTIYYKNVK